MSGIISGRTSAITASTFHQFSLAVYLTFTACSFDLGVSTPDRSRVETIGRLCLPVSAPISLALIMVLLPYRFPAVLITQTHVVRNSRSGWMLWCSDRKRIKSCGMS